MSGRPSVVDQIANRLSADEALTAVATGGVWKRPLKREGPGATAAAFFPAPPYQPRPCVVVMDGGEAADGLGPRQAFNGYPTLYLYAPATDNGWTDIANLYDRARTVLVGWRFPLPNGTGAVVERVAGRVGARDAPELEGALIDTMRLQVNGLWLNTE